jgi:hemerythrin superfamily protein
MQSSKTTPTTKSPASRPGSRSDAIALLTKDHKEVKQLFHAYEKLAKAGAAGDERQTVAQKICELLTVHATLEEDIFYPVMRENLDADSLMDKAEVEHATVKDLVSQIQVMDADNDLYDAKVKVLGEYVEHHVQEEEGVMFAKALKSKVDLIALGTQLKAYKEELMEATTSAA